MPGQVIRVCAAALLAGAVTPAASAPESVYTSIANRDCKFDPIGDEPGDAEDQLKRCPGLGGANVIVNSVHTRLEIGFEWPGRPKVEPRMNVLSAWSAGFKVEWRGERTRKGFVPFAATVRMRHNKEGTRVIERQTLEVVKVSRGEACLMGRVTIGLHLRQG